jgi:hypothetical protein
MEKQDIHIANCHTYPKFRGNRLFSFSLSFIGKSVSEHVVWVGTRNNNTPSIKSIEKAGYLKTANACKSKFLGIYKLKAIE